MVFTIVEEMKAAKCLAATFFFSQNHAQSAIAAGLIIPAITYQLALAFPRIREEIVMVVESDEMLPLPGKSWHDQLQELVIKPLHTLKSDNRCLTHVLWPNIHLIFASRSAHDIRISMQAVVHEIPPTTNDQNTIQDVID
ncbi:hypothetical protein EV702DRAFT_1193962 [Suillus placidus]|uniref:Uncharacterized protein n=1 Tax=Suillus placidus TaxID=48579 RepID=A0A9P7A163_9AGAM|nr:hypothetical protein EV702DRAFT_1193962 [Suillus placidus]